MVNLNETQRHGVNLLVHVEFVPRDLLSAPQQWLDVQLDARDQRAQNQYQRNLHLVGRPERSRRRRHGPAGNHRMRLSTRDA